MEQNLADYHTLLNKEKAAPADITVALYHLYDEFKNSQLDNHFFENTFLYFPMSKLIMTSEGTYDEDVYFKKKMIFHQYPENYFGQLVKQSFQYLLSSYRNSYAKEKMAAFCESTISN